MGVRGTPGDFGSEEGRRLVNAETSPAMLYPRPGRSQLYLAKVGIDFVGGRKEVTPRLGGGSIAWNIRAGGLSSSQEKPLTPPRSLEISCIYRSRGLNFMGVNDSFFVYPHHRQEHENSSVHICRFPDILGPYQS